MLFGALSKATTKHRRVVSFASDGAVPASPSPSSRGAMESLAEKNLRDGWEASARFTNAWLAEAKKARATSS